MFFGQVASSDEVISAWQDAIRPGGAAEEVSPQAVSWARHGVT